MLFTYREAKEPIVVHENQIFVQNGSKDHIRFHPNNLIFLTLSSPQLGQITDNDIFVKHQRMTQDYQVYQKLLQEKQKILPLLRQALVDPSLPDINYFPIGNHDTINGISTQSVSHQGGKIEFLERIAWLQDRKAIPEIRELLFHTNSDAHNYENMTHVTNGSSIKNESIKTLGQLGAKNVLYEYLMQHKTEHHRHIQSALIGLMEAGLEDTDLPMMMRLCERYESFDLDPENMDGLHLNSTFYNPWLGSGRFMFYKGVMQDLDNDAPVQRLICKAIARIGTQKALETLEDIYKHACYYEMALSALTGIRHRAHIQQDAFKHNATLVPGKLIERIYIEYCGTNNRDMDKLKGPMQRARSGATYNKYYEKRHNSEQQEKEREKQRGEKNAAYFKTLQPGNSINIQIPYDEIIGIVRENDGEILVVEAQFMNKQKRGRRKFWIKNGKSKGPACFIDSDGWGEKPYFFSLIVPQPPKEEGYPSIPQDIKIHIFEPKENTGDNDPQV